MMAVDVPVSIWPGHQQLSWWPRRVGVYHKCHNVIHFPISTSQWRHINVTESRTQLDYLFDSLLRLTAMKKNQSSTSMTLYLGKDQGPVMRKAFPGHDAIMNITKPHTAILCGRIWIDRYMMTSCNGNIFRVTGHLCGEFTGPGGYRLW